jgi:excisionase family DNA binding protein
MADELERQGIHVSAAQLRQKALEIGACHILGDALFLLPEDVDALLRHGKHEPAPVISPPPTRNTRGQKQKKELDPGETRRLYTSSMLAKRWGCSEKHVRNLVDEGKLGCFRLGKLIRIKHSDVEAAEKVFAEDAILPVEPIPQKDDPANEVMTRARVNRPRAKRLDR